MKRIPKHNLLECRPPTVLPLDDKAYKNATYNNRRWQAIRRIQLDREPLCRHCKAQGRITEATQVDHIQRIKWGGTNDASNLQSLCASCHSKKTQAEHRRTV